MMKPLLALKVNPIISPCSPLHVSMLGSHGSGGREWKNISLTITDTDNFEIHLEENVLQTYVKTGEITIESSLFEVGQDYIVISSICNFLNLCRKDKAQF